MNPPVEEWIECSQLAVERALRSMEDNIPYKQRYLIRAVSNLEDEIYWRKVSLKEKYCE